MFSSVDIRLIGIPDYHRGSVCINSSDIASGCYRSSVGAVSESPLLAKYVYTCKEFDLIFFVGISAAVAGSMFGSDSYICCIINYCYDYLFMFLCVYG